MIQRIGGGSVRSPHYLSGLKPALISALAARLKPHPFKTDSKVSPYRVMTVIDPTSGKVL